MDLHLTNRTVLVTGGASGLGKSISTILAQEGANVALNYVTNPDAQKVADALAEQYGVKTVAVYADVSKEDDVKKTFDEIETKIGSVDHVVNNAAIVANPKCEELTLTEFQRCVEINLQGTFLVSREAVQRWRRNPAVSRSLVNISSQAALRGSQSGKTAYDMTKAGILGFTRSLALEVAADGIRVNAVLPGIMLTNIIRKFIEADPDKFNKRSPLGRIAQTDEIARVTVFLLSDAASYMTGATVDVSGGMAMH